MTPIAGKVALVTGGSRGIGAAIARRLAADGADVAITYISAADRAKQVAADVASLGRRAAVIQADLSEEKAAAAAVRRAVEELGRLDILVNNAGVFAVGPLAEVAPEELNRVLAIHVRSVFLASQEAAQHLPDGGRIISLGSSLAQRVPFPGTALYSMSKSALIGLTKGLARDLGPRGITANVVHPGSTDTEMNPADGLGAEEQAKQHALGRFLAPEDIAATVAHLAGDGGRSITGTEIAVDGGWSA